MMLATWTLSSAYRDRMTILASVRSLEEAWAHMHSIRCGHTSETMNPSKSLSNSHSIHWTGGLVLAVDCILNRFLPRGRR